MVVLLACVPTDFGLIKMAQRRWKFNGIFSIFTSEFPLEIIHIFQIDRCNRLYIGILNAVDGASGDSVCAAEFAGLIRVDMRA